MTTNGVAHTPAMLVSIECVHLHLRIQTCDGVELGSRFDRKCAPGEIEEYEVTLMVGFGVRFQDQG